MIYTKQMFWREFEKTNCIKNPIFRYYLCKSCNESDAKLSFLRVESSNSLNFRGDSTLHM